jgi:hypothetical protein
LKTVVRVAVIAMLAACFMPHHGFAQIPNPGFESWSGGNPTDWWTSNIIITGIPFNVNVTQSSDAHSGSFAVQGAVIVSAAGTPSPAVMQSGIDGSGFPINSRPAALYGWYKFASDSGDGLNIITGFTKNHSGMGYGIFTTTTPQATYKEFVVNSIFVTADIPDSALISIALVNGGPRTHIGSKFWVDDLSFGTAADVKEFGNGIPVAFALDQNYPNPFNPSTKIQFEIPEAGFVTLKVYDLLGQEVASLVNGQLEPGRYRAEFDAANLPSGIYFYRLQAGDFTEAKEMIVLK